MFHLLNTLCSHVKTNYIAVFSNLIKHCYECEVELLAYLNHIGDPDVFFFFYLFLS